MKPSPNIVRAFSLIEVLVSVVVLALGLLGLAAVFPAVLRQQKEAVISRTSDSAKNTIREAFARTAGIEGESSYIAWDFLSLDSFVSAQGVPTCPDPVVTTGEWEVDWIWPRLPTTIAANYRASGDLVVGDGQYFTCVPGTPPNGAPTPAYENVRDILGREPTLLRAFARLYPEPFTGVEPEYVWDFVPRKLPSGAVQVAVFVRRIDQNIAVPRGSTLSKALVGLMQGGGNQLTRTLVPVAEDASGAPTGNGRGEYSMIRRAALNIDATDPTLVRLQVGGNFQDRYIGRLGQKLVDEFESPSVQTVVDRRVEGNEVVLTLSPGYGEEQRGAAVYFVFTPQLAVDAFVETVR